jgi:hypothetical protein
MNPARAHNVQSRETHKKPSDTQDRLWSARVTRESDALDLEAGVFSLADPKAIARSLKRSAQASTRRKSGPFQSAMSMLTFYMNRAGSSLSAERRAVLDQAKVELRREFGRSPERSVQKERGVRNG